MPPPASKGNDDPGVLLYAEGALESLTSAPNDVRGPKGARRGGIPPAPLLKPFTASPFVLKARPGFFLPAQKLTPAKMYMEDYWEKQQQLHQQQRMQQHLMQQHLMQQQLINQQLTQQQLIQQQLLQQERQEQQLLMQQRRQQQLSPRRHSDYPDHSECLTSGPQVIDSRVADDLHSNNCGVWLYGTCSLCQARGRLTPSCPRAAAYAGAATAGNATAAAQAAQAAQATAAAQGSTTAAPEELFAFDAAAESVPSAESYALLTKGGKKLHLNRRDKDITEKKGSRHAHKTRHHRRTSTYDEGYLQGTPGRTHVTPPVVAPMEFPTGREKEHSIRMMEKFADPTNNAFRAGRNRSCSRNSSNSSRSSESSGSSGSIRSRLRLQSPELHQQRNRRHFHSTKGQRKHEKMRGRINPPVKSPGTALEEAKTDELKEIVLRMLDCRRLETQIEVQMEQLQLFESLLKQLPPSSSKATDGALGALEGGPADSADSPAEAALLQQLQHDDLSFLKAALSVGLYPACILNTPQGSLVSTESAVPSDPTPQQAAQPKQGPMLSQQGSAVPTEKCVNSKNGMMTPKQGIQLSKQPFPPSAKLSSSKGANAKQGSLSLKQGTLPLKQEPLPVKQGQLPGKQGPLPLKQDPLPLKQGPLPLKQGPPPLKQGPLLLKQGPLPLKQGSLPLKQGPLPLKQGLQAPKEGPAPLKQGPLPLKKGPLSLKQGPLPLKQGPLPLKKGPPLLLKGP